MRMFKKLWPCMRRYRVYTLLAPLAVILEVLLEVRIPIFMAQLVDEGIPSGDVSYILRKGAWMIFMAFLALLCGTLSSKFASTASIGFGSELRKEIFNKIQGFSFSNMDKYSTPSLVTRLTTDITNIQNSFMLIIRMLVRSPFMLVSATIMAMSFDKDLVVIFFLAIPILAAALVLIMFKTFPLFQSMLKKYDFLNASIQENLISIRVVKSFVRADYEKEKFRLTNDDLRKASIKAEKIIVYAMPLMMLVMYSCIISVLWFGGNKIIIGDMAVGDLMGFISYITQILISLMMIAMVFVNIVISKASLGRVMEIINEEVDIEDGKNLELEAGDGSIIFEGVSFKYSEDAESDILESINLEIRSGERVGIIGGTGAAKTTLVQLIPRLYDADSGCVYVGGHNVKDYTLSHLRETVSMVLQKNVLFSGTIKENLRWGNENASDEEIIEACKAAQAHDFVESFSNGYETVLGQGGVNLSGGQKQRLCIARALLKKPKIIILDDSTSAVDTATDAKIREGFEKHLNGTTTIIIAQRISSISDADKIIVMNDGQIHDIGTHEELLLRNEIYQDVYDSQQKGVVE